MKNVAAGVVALSLVLGGCTALTGQDPLQQMPPPEVVDTRNTFERGLDHWNQKGDTQVTPIDTVEDPEGATQARINQTEYEVRRLLLDRIRLACQRDNTFLIDTGTGLHEQYGCMMYRQLSEPTAKVETFSVSR